MIETLDDVFAAFDAYGARRYGEDVTQLEHMLQSAELAVADAAPDALIIAALLHDIGHFEAREVSDTADLQHEVVGAKVLARLFGPEVWRPVALHVAAKRYLCACAPGYLDALSPASLTSLTLQGGVFTPEQARRFEALPDAAAALRLRRYDDEAKRTGAVSPPLETYRPLLERQRMTV